MHAWGWGSFLRTPKVPAGIRRVGQRDTTVGGLGLVQYAPVGFQMTAAMNCNFHFCLCLEKGGKSHSSS